MLTTLVFIGLIISIISNIFLFGPIIISYANASDIPNSYNNVTTLNLSVLRYIPRINWYDFMYNNSGTWESVLNTQMDIDGSNQYRFVVNISSDQGWDDISFSIRSRRIPI